MALITPELEPAFRAAGWKPGRLVAVPETIPKSHTAWTILAELNGISMSGRGTYPEEAAAFQPLAGSDALPLKWEAELKTALIGIGEIHNRHGELYVDTLGRLFGNSLIHDAFWFIGPNFAAGIGHLLTDARSRPMLLHDQDRVRFYGHDMTRADPEVLTAESLEKL